MTKTKTNSVTSVHGLIEDHTETKDAHPHKVHGWGFAEVSEKETPRRTSQLLLQSGATYYGYVQEGTAHLNPIGGGGSFKIVAGMFFRCSNGIKLQGGRGFVVECPHDHGEGLLVGGPFDSRSDKDWDFFADGKMVHRHLKKNGSMSLDANVQGFIVTRGNAMLQLKTSEQKLPSATFVTAPGKGKTKIVTDKNEADIICFSPDKKEK